ncbi:MAG: choice-of-anchor D domain-containing protein [Deltaproteobacteria bacterium]|nr:MAG: choice-of-anchor D domain-containing protein [Deltaproteobacteria bacterium]
MMQPNRGHWAQASLLAILVLATGCPPSDTGIEDIDDPVRVNEQVVVEPNLLTFGPVERETSESHPFTIRNEGDTLVEVTSIGIVASDAFELVDAGGPFQLEPGEERDITVRYNAANLVDEGRVSVSLLGTEFTETVELVGETLIPVLQVDPVDLGSTKLTCPALEQPLVIRNVGSAPAEVSSVLLAAAPAGWVSDPQTPLTIQPGAFIQLPITMATDMAMVADGAASVSADDPGSPHQVSVVGEVSAGQDIVVDLFEQPEEPGGIDILFTIDQSCSMEHDIQQLSAAMGSMVAELASFEADWQAAVVPFFQGCHAGAYFTRDTPNLETEFAAAALQIGNPGADDTERGLEMARDAVLAANGGCNAGMLRPDAKLAVISVSDERDQSAPYDRGVPDDFSHWTTYVNEVNAVVPGTTFHGIVGAPDLPLWDFNEQGETCAERGEGYAQAISATGGLRLDVCESEWTGHTAALGEAIGEAAAGIRWHLTHEPIAETITVTVDGVESTDWTFDPESGDIVFGTPPAPGSQIAVSYTDAESC